jgi:RHS repeat-associated protein
MLDHEGSLVMTTDSSGNVTGSNVLSPYGQKISSNTTDAYSYAGLYQDTEYGGDAATFRNYSEEQVRWTRPDPYNGSYDTSNPQSMNRYVYAMNNPLNHIDPTGLDGGWPILGLGAESASQIAAESAEEGLGGPVAFLKLAYDAATFAYGVARCW